MPEQLAISARNQFKGKVISLTPGMVNTEVVLDIGNGASVAAVITNKSRDHLDLKEGSEAWAFFKASQVIISKEPGLKTSARNNFPGKVGAVVKGAVNSEVRIDLPSGQAVTAIVTNPSAERLALAQGVEVAALIKAFHVILGVK
ncbi:MAG: TOBE domain-containing protein [Deltaproteobacteria bacterium]|jgi:molybdate transport system regulatory protein|nr:TOBE domain-containing protein [Deltaproteobacteria bacterium]